MTESDTMVGRVADAVLSTLLDRRGIRQPLEEIRDSDPETWAELRDTIGRLAIEAMRVPTEAMVAAAESADDSGSSIFGEPFVACSHEEAWNLMIAAALGEE